MRRGNARPVAGIRIGMIELYSWGTPNGYKVSIALEELGLPYDVHPIDIGSGDQLTPEFLAINPNNKIPAIVDTDGPGGGRFALAESGAILVYLADKTGRLMPAGKHRYTALQWIMFQMGHVGPMLGQLGHFRSYAPEKLPYAVDRYAREASRLFHILDKRLGEVEYLAGEYSMADIATFPWIRSYRKDVGANDYPNLTRWLDAISARPAVARGVLVPPRREAPLDARAREVLFGSTQYERR